MKKRAFVEKLYFWNEKSKKQNERYALSIVNFMGKLEIIPFFFIVIGLK